jgi:hypothetical protein
MINVKIKFLAPAMPGAWAIRIYVTCLSQFKGPPRGAHGDTEGVITPGRKTGAEKAFEYEVIEKSVGVVST